MVARAARPGPPARAGLGPKSTGFGAEEGAKALARADRRGTDGAPLQGTAWLSSRASKFGAARGRRKRPLHGAAFGAVSHPSLPCVTDLVVVQSGPPPERGRPSGRGPRGHQPRRSENECGLAAGDVPPLDRCGAPCHAGTGPHGGSRFDAAGCGPAGAERRVARWIRTGRVRDREMPTPVPPRGTTHTGARLTVPQRRRVHTAQPWVEGSGVG